MEWLVLDEYEGCYLLLLNQFVSTSDFSGLFSLISSDKFS